MNPWPYLLVGSAQAFDLSASLPAAVQRGGSFAVDASGDPLPAGLSLSTAGLLSVGSAVVGSAAGVVFSYTEPL